MKKIVPFKKDLSFDKSIYEISSISLEHTLKLKEENQISGQFIISGTYKLTEASINVDPFEYKLPFDISIDKKYETKNIDVDINDFYYELINNEILSINIEVIIDGLEEREEIIMPEVKEVTPLPKEESKKNKEETRQEMENEETQTISQTVEEVDNTSKSIFENLDENERYSVYKVHIVTENDTIESILQKYQINREELEAYNDLSDMQIGSKLIIQAHED